MKIMKNKKNNKKIINKFCRIKMKIYKMRINKIKIINKIKMINN